MSGYISGFLVLEDYEIVGNIHRNDSAIFSTEKEKKTNYKLLEFKEDKIGN